MFDGLPNLRLPEAPGIRNAPTLRQRPDDAETPPAQFHLTTTSTGPTRRSSSYRLTAATRQRDRSTSPAQLGPCSAATSSADSSTNIKPPHEFTNRTAVAYRGTLTTRAEAVARSRQPPKSEAIAPAMTGANTANDP